MASHVEKVLNKRVGDLAPTVVQIGKRKLGLNGEGIPEDIREEFIRSIISVCKNDVWIDVGQDLKKELEHSLD